MRMLFKPTEPLQDPAHNILPDGWHVGDTCFLITNKAKKYALAHTVESFDGTYFGVRGRTGLFHHVSPRRMFHTKEEAVASLEISEAPVIKEQNMTMGGIT